MSELDSLYREVILDHYKNPHGHGVIDGADAEAEGQNPLCGDEVSIAVAFDGDTIADVKFQGRGCAISQAATSMLMDMVKGRSAAGGRLDVAATSSSTRSASRSRPCASSARCSASASSSSRCTRAAARRSRRSGRGSTTSSSSSRGGDRRRPGRGAAAGRGEDRPRRRRSRSASTTAAASFYAIEDRCSHDDGPLCEGDFEPGDCVAICPRHGSRFDVRTGRALTLPAYLPVDTFEVVVEDGGPCKVVGSRRLGLRSRVSREERVARNEALFREVNEQIKQVNEDVARGRRRRRSSASAATRSARAR